MPGSPAAAPEGLIISGRYQLLKKLGSGTSGTVFLARDAARGREVALKIIRTERLGREGVEALQAEFRALSALCHPRIAAAFDFGYTEDHRIPYYTREYVEGEPLAAGPPGSPGPASPREYLRPIFDLLDALGYLHAHGFLHLDIHAGNLIQAGDRERGCVLIDFGLVRPPRSANSSAVLGLRASLPPELLAGEPVGPQADLYSAGRLLLYRLSGSYQGDPRLPREIPGWGPRITLALERILEKTLDREAGQRFRSAAELSETLALAVGDPRGPPAPHEPGETTFGREAELAEIESLIRRTASGGTGLWWLTGPRGIGKTRILTEARWRAQLRGLQLAETRFLPGRGADPPLEQALAAAFPSSNRSASGWLAPLAAEHGGTSSERARRAARAYFAQEGPPLLVLLDDCEHAGGADRALLSALLAECAGREGQAGGRRGMGIILAGASPPDRSLLPPQGRRAIRRLRPLNDRQARELLRRLLRPLDASERLLRRAAREAGGLPGPIRRAARALHARWGKARAIPDAAEVPADLLREGGLPPLWLEGRTRLQLQVLRALAILARPATLEEIAAAAELSVRAGAGALAGLRKEEAVAAYRREGRLRYYLTPGEAATALRREVGRGGVRSVHLRLVTYLEARRAPSPRDHENLATHLRDLGRRNPARNEARRAAAGFRDQGLLEEAARVLSAALSAERQPREVLRLAEELSDVRERAGDHQEAAAVLLPLVRGEAGPLTAREEVRLRRRLAVHLHRSGKVTEALDQCRRVQLLAHRQRDLEDLVLVASELAELHTLRGEHGKAEEACREGLSLLEGSTRSAPGERFHRSMLVNLRASLGHLELRRQRFDRAREEFEGARAMAGPGVTTALRALIENNLGIVFNHLNRFRAAVASFRRAERLLVRSGDQSGIVQAIANQALIAAKLGDAEEARRHLERAEPHVLRQPGTRLEFLAGLARGTVAHLLGDHERASAFLREAIPLGAKLGDGYLVRFAEVYLAESDAACGRLGEALRRLRASVAVARTQGPAALLRVAAARLLGLEALAGSRRAVALTEKILDETPRTPIEVLEAGNDLQVARARKGTEARALLARAGRFFSRSGITAGAWEARLIALELATGEGDREGVRAALVDLVPRGGPGRGTPPHRQLAVLDPLLRAEAHFFLGDSERARDFLQDAAGAIAGLPFLDLDARIELLRARLEEREGDREEARRHLHRSRSAAEILARSLPSGSRSRFLAHPRFAELRKLVESFDRATPRRPAPGREDAEGFQGMVGRSEGMLGVYRTIERLAGEERPVVITGETGAGKELVARALHALSARRRGPFLALHCASLPPQLFEAELFGYRQGAYSGADQDRPGLLQSLAGGTLLLDEITALGLETQAKLLQVLDSRRVRPLGSVEPFPVDVRILASSALDLAAAQAAGRLRPDLRYRLGTLEIAVPPLRSRREDLALLARHFLEQHARRLDRPVPRLDVEALAVLERHDWPGNVRELEAVMVRAILLGSPGLPLEAAALRDALERAPRKSIFAEEVLEGRSLDELRRELDRAYLRLLFRRTRGDLEEMRKTLGLKRSGLYAWFRKVGIDLPALRNEIQG